MCKIQALYNACSSVFGGGEAPPPSPDEIRWLQHILGSLECCDVGIEIGNDDDTSGLETTVQEMIKYTHIYECDEFSMGVFCLPAGTTIPLHDHPEMVVLSKVLCGSLSIKSYDWVRQPDDCPHPTYKRSGLASLTLKDKVFDSSSPATVLFPMTGGNIHSVTALTTCAFIDVLTPPYSNQQGRLSTYYIEKPIPSLPGFVNLEAFSTDVPKDLLVTGEAYRGPKLDLHEFDEDDDDGHEAYCCPESSYVSELI